MVFHSDILSVMTKLCSTKSQSL